VACALAVSGPAAAQWPAHGMDSKSVAVDLSFLNAAERPAGLRGFVRAVGDELVFADGTRARFWGTNITAYALFGTPRADVKTQAQRLSRLGFNLVRLHHHDSHWVDPNVFGARAVADTRTLDPLMLEKLDWWIKCLKEEGIYAWLDLHVQRRLKPADGIDGIEETAHGKAAADVKGFSYVNPGIQAAMQRFNQAYLDRVNVHTQTRYQDEPAIVGMLITNENDVTHRFGGLLLPGKGAPKHSALYMARAEAFAAKTGLPRQEVWRASEYGAAKLFLNDLERSFHAEMIRHLRGLGIKVPIVTTSTWGNPLVALPALTAGDIIDAHAYGGAGELENNPLRAPNMMHWLAAAQVAGRPFSVSEWNVERFPVHDRHVIPLYIGAFASLQGWDALMQYAYAQVPLDGAGYPSNWHAFNDPSLLAMLPAAALLYRRGDVRQARTVYAFAPGKDQLFGRKISPATSVALRTAERSRLVIALPRATELPWLEESAVSPAATLITDPDLPLMRADAAEALSDTGELRRNWVDGTYTIDTPRSQAAMGRIGGRTFKLADVEIAALTPNAAVAVQSLDGKPIRQAARILVSRGARSVPVSERRLPFRVEPVEGRLVIRAREGLRLYAAAMPGDEPRQLPAPYADGRYLVELPRVPNDAWLLLR
jgi:hypothetical protein